MTHMHSKKFLSVMLLTVLTCAGAWAQTDRPLVALDAAKLPEGPISAWANTGSLGGSFKNNGTNPQVRVIDGVKAVDFTGKDYMLADFNAPAQITGDKPWTAIIKTYCRDTTAERALVSWANRPDSCLELEYGEAVGFGAIGTWSQNVSGWLNNVPTNKTWHTLIYSYAGGQDGEFQAWADGDLRVSKKFSLTTKADRPFVLGACMSGDPAPNVNYTHQIDGAIASLKIYGRGFSSVESWNASGFDSALLMAPRRGAVLDTLTTTLEWQPGNPAVASYDIYLGTDRAAVESATNKLKIGAANDWRKSVFRGNQKAANTKFGPLQLNLGNTYYWRIDQLDASGEVAQRGIVSEFKTETANASEPTPADNYIFVEGGKHELKWKPGKYAVKQNVYIGESIAEVLSKRRPAFANLPATTTSVELPIKNPVLGKDYYWRVESINSNKLAVSKGDVWSFRTVSKKLKIYISSGQSNSVGCSMVTGMPEKFKGINKNVIIFVRGECRLGDYGWASLKEGLGSSFGDRDGKGTIGPELTFGYSMAPKDPAEIMAIIKIAWGGTNLAHQWRPPSAGGTTGELYTNWVKYFKEAMSKLDPAFEPEIVGMIWMQGESDTGVPEMANEYESNLKCFINDIRAEVKKPNMPFVLGTISKADAWKAYGDVVRAAEAKVAETVPFTATFPTDDYGMGDPWHYDTAGMISLGERFADAMKKLEEK